MIITHKCIIMMIFIVICSNVSINLEMILLSLWLISLFIQENIITLVINLEDELINTRTQNNYNRDKDKYREIQTPTPASLASRLNRSWKRGLQTTSNPTDNYIGAKGRSRSTQVTMWNPWYSGITFKLNYIDLLMTDPTLYKSNFSTLFRYLLENVQ